VKCRQPLNVAETRRQIEEWLNATLEARGLINEAKEQTWIDFLDELEVNPDTTTVYHQITEWFS
jgi:uncharacterized protein (DUF58 family)